MKSAFLATILFLAGSSFLTPAKAQKKAGAIQRCATMDRFRLYEANSLLYKSNSGRSAKTTDGPDQGQFRLQGLVTVPVVVHIVLPNPYIITDADVQAQIDRLNKDFAGLNEDSTNAANFYAVRGHSQIQFCLARRTPAGLLTNGIERRASNTGSDADAATDPIKRGSLGGLDSWNNSQYLNLWIGTDASGQGVLGYADNIGPSAVLDDGVFLNYQSFGSSSCYTIPEYNRGRTGTHEIGHYFGLYHIWGDDNGACSGDDFAQLPTTAGCTLPTGLYNPAGQGNGATDVGDTPNQSDMTTNCPGGIAADACAPAATGKMYQNHMDYTQDACLSMFTKKQVSRMEWVLDNCRASLKTSLGCQPPAGAITLDAAPLSSVSPGGFELIGCQTVFYTNTFSCPGTITPKFRVVNNGTNNITSLTVGYSYDGGATVTNTVAVNIPQGGTYVASFAAIPVAVGLHMLRFFTSAPNGQADQVTANDSYVQTFLVMSPTGTPVTEGFETALPLANWTIDNPDLDFTWQRTTPGRDGSAGKLSINNYLTEAPGHKDDFRSTAIDVDPSSAYVLTFDVAYKNDPDPQNADSLAVLISTDCGQSFATLYKKGGASLSTAGSTTIVYAAPADNEWRTETVNLNGPVLSSGKIILLFRNISGWGNYIHIDNINLVKTGARDLHVSGVLSPGTTACSATVAPTVSVENVGFETVTSFSVGYRIDNGAVQQQLFTQNIAPNATVNVTLPVGATVPGTHTITAFSFNPVTGSGSGDTRLGNDTLQKTFTVVKPLGTPFSEGFEATLLPAGWSVFNPDNNVTWERRTPGKNSQYSAFIDNYNNNVIGQVDDLRTPFINVAGADSLLIRFDVAYKPYSGTQGDNLSVLTTSDCANSFTTVYSKTGAALATSGDTNNEFLTPEATDWRTETVALDAQAMAAGSIGLAFRNTNGYGNNIFIDNINISTVYKRDLQVVSIQQPKNLVCSSTATPSVLVRNLGTDTVKSFKVVYSVNNGASVSQTVSGLSLARGAETTVNLPAITGLVQGAYILRVYATDLVGAKGSGDLNATNDTASQSFSVPGTVAAPLVENFTGTVFPPNGWSTLNNDTSYTWQRYSAGSSNAGSAFINTFRYLSNGQKDDLVSPAVSFGNVDSVSVSFDLAAASFGSPGTGVPTDTLEVLVTKDCGASFTTVYKKGGNALQTVPTPSTTEFFPQGSNDWRRETLDISSVANKSPVVIFFRATNNNGNNIFLDNINVQTKTLPALLKQQGYLFYPTPFQSSFTVWHYQTPMDLQYIRVMNAAGQTVWTKTFSGNAGKQEIVDLTGKAAGVYIVEIGYTGGKKSAAQKIIKE